MLPLPRPFLPALTIFAVALLGWLGPAPHARAQNAVERQVPNSMGQLQLSFAPIVKRVAPAVVNVYAAHVVENQNPFMADPFFRQFFGGRMPQQEQPRSQRATSLGSGVVVSDDGYISDGVNAFLHADTRAGRSGR